MTRHQNTMFVFLTYVALLCVVVLGVGIVIHALDKISTLERRLLEEEEKSTILLENVTDLITITSVLNMTEPSLSSYSYSASNAVNLDAAVVMTDTGAELTLPAGMYFMGYHASVQTTGSGSFAYWNLQITDSNNTALDGSATLFEQATDFITTIVPTAASLFHNVTTADTFKIRGQHTNVITQMRIVGPAHANSIDDPDGSFVFWALKIA